MVSVCDSIYRKNDDGREDVKMLKAEVMKYLLDEAIARIKEIDKFNKRYGDAYYGLDNLGRITETRPTKALVIDNMKKIRKLALEISKEV